MRRRRSFWFLGLAGLLGVSSVDAQLPIRAPEATNQPLGAGVEAPAVDPSASSPPASSEPALPPPPAPAAAQAPPAAPASPAATAVVKAPPRAVAAPPAEKSQRRLRWTFPRFRWWEYVAAAAVTVGNVSLEVAYQGAEPKERWRDPVLFDAPVRDLLNGNERWHRTATLVGDWTWYGVQNYVLLDGILTPLLSDKLNADVALQLTLLNWQAVGLTGLLSRTAHVTVGRTRPSLQGCSNEEGAENKCEFRGASFFSGHTAMTAVSAALGCVNHHYLPLYGGGLADALVCPVLITGAATVGIARIVTDRHWVSDVLVGWAVGGAVGFGLPYALHYGPTALKAALRPTPSTAFVPWADKNSGGLRFIGML